MNERILKPRPSRSSRLPPVRKVKIGRQEVFTSGLAPSFWNDLYFAALTVGWPAFLGGLAAVFVVINLFFAVVYSASPTSIANSGGNFENLFYFSAETLTTVGYGELFPQTRYGHIVVSVEVFTGLFFTATMLGLIFARLSRPRARLIFADRLVVGPYEGQRTLSARVANARLNILNSANARLWMLGIRHSAEGVAFRRFEELKLLRAENPTFALSWTLLHVIDAASPLAGRAAEDLAAEDALFILTISGQDETTGQTVQARESYRASDLIWDHRYVDILSVRDDGSTMLDYRRFHAVEPIAATVKE